MGRRSALARADLLICATGRVATGVDRLATGLVSLMSSASRSASARRTSPRQRGAIRADARGKRGFAQGVTHSFPARQRSDAAHRGALMIG